MKSIDFREEIGAWRQMEDCRQYFFADLIKATSAIYDIPVSTLVSHRRDREITKLRWRVYWIGRTELGLSYTQVATLFRRDHTTILHGIRKYKELAYEDTETAAREQLKKTATAIARGQHVKEEPAVVEPQ
jgi:chromosomal replication initiation ATPase DnaA